MCKGQVIVSVDNLSDRSKGKVWIFQRYNISKDELRLMNSITGIL